MTTDTYLICGRGDTILASRQDAEMFLVGEGFNLPAAIHALDNVWLCGDHINLQGYVIRRPSYSKASERAAARLRKGMSHADYKRIIDAEFRREGLKA